MGNAIGVLLIAAAVCAALSTIRSFLTPRRERMRQQRQRNFRRGITMRPGFSYRDPDGTVCMSQTGRERDCICGKVHKTGPHGEVIR